MKKGDLLIRLPNAGRPWKFVLFCSDPNGSYVDFLFHKSTANFDFIKTYKDYTTAYLNWTNDYELVEADEDGS